DGYRYPSTKLAQVTPKHGLEVIQGLKWRSDRVLTTLGREPGSKPRPDHVAALSQHDQAPKPCQDHAKATLGRGSSMHTSPRPRLSHAGAWIQRDSTQSPTH
ncbi:hypothetical protein PIB30_106143, partial [Stylosanthes scabra]|nr:hypothetical protein [Stylosanthes scabra]